uniref:Uncharacterized protein n=1 Tax=viral metagenome TaxID=1070528 RepID=A0A6C0EC31_9ZZZZ
MIYKQINDVEIINDQHDSNVKTLKKHLLGMPNGVDFNSTFLNEHYDYILDIPYSPCKNLINKHQKLNINIKKKYIFLGKRIIKKEIIN